MAITYVGAGTPAFGNNTVTIGLPASTTSGDLLLLLIETANDGTFTTPTGWFAHPSPPGIGTSAGSTSTKLWAFYRYQDGTVTGVSPQASPLPNHKWGVVVAFRGVATWNNPFTGSATNTSSGNTTITFGSVTTPSANAMVVDVVAHGVDTTGGQVSGWTNANLASVSEGFDDSTTNGSGGGIAVSYGIKATAGAVTATTATLATASREWATLSFYLEDANYAAWTPAKLSNLALWLDPSDTGTVTLSSGKVSSITDKSGNGRTFSARYAGSSGQPHVETINSLQAYSSTYEYPNGLYRNNSDMNSITNGDYTMVVIANARDYNDQASNTATTSGYQVPFLVSPEGGGANKVVPGGYNWGTGGYWLSAGDFATTQYFIDAGDFSSTGSAEIPRIFSLTKSGTSATWHRNGVSEQTGTATSYTAASTDWAYGGTGDAYRFTGWVGDAIVVTGAMGTTERQLLEGYLAHKWGQTALLDSGHPYKTINPASPTPPATYKHTLLLSI